jgi:hypothetical protein
MNSRRSSQWKCVRLVAVITVALYATVSEGVIRRHDREDAKYIALGSRFEMVGRLGGVTCTLIAPRWAITAAHTLEENPPFPPLRATFGGKSYVVARVFVHPARRRGAVDSSADLALLELAEEVKGITPVRLYEGDDEPEKIVHFVGYGMAGTGLTGPVEERGQRRAATTRIEGALENSLLTWFKAPPLGTDLEGIGGPGDSGAGLLYTDDRGVWLMGVSAFNSGNPDEKTSAVYWTFEGAARISTRRAWINEVMKSPSAHAFWSEPVRVDGGQWPRDNFGRRAAAFFEAFNSGEEAAIARFLTEHRPPSRTPLVERTASWKELMEQYGPYEVHSYQRDRGGRYAVLVHSKRADLWRGVMFEFSDAAPHLITAMQMWDAEAPR